jgi:hypothetical protein
MGKETATSPHRHLVRSAVPERERTLTLVRQRATLRHSLLPHPSPRPPVTESEPLPAPAADTWDGILAALRRRYPGQRDSVLFCIYKLQQNSQLTLRDFRAEAELHGIPMAGRSLHSARILLGLAKDDSAPAASPALPDLALPVRTPRPARRERAAEDGSGDSIEHKVLSAVRQIQSAAGAESEQLRNAIRQAIAILQRALGS